MISLPNPSNSPDARALSSAHPLTPMRVTIVTPFSPLQRHDHAADDLASPAFAAIAQLLTLTVITRGTHTSGVRRIEQDGYVIHELPRRNPSLLRRLTGFYPAGLRSDWSPHDTLGTLRLLGQIPTDHVHFEYLQPAEVALRLPAGWSITLHDITTAVFREHFERSQGPEKLYRWLEWRRLERIETLAIRRGNPVFALSDRDVSTVNRFHGRGALLRIGIPQHLRDPGRAPQVPTFVFAGAMGRHANIEAAKYLAHQVMPEVWRLMPDARLRLVGASPSPEVLRLADDQRVAVVGRVESIEDEYRAATAVFAPTVVGSKRISKSRVLPAPMFKAELRLTISKCPAPLPVRLGC